MKAIVNNIEMFWQEHGRGDAVLLVHGFPLTHEMWTPLIEHLGDGHRFIMPDLRGFGKTELTEHRTLNQFVEDLAALLDYLDLRDAVIVGLSMGGYIAFEFYRRCPHRVTALVLADTRPDADTHEIAEKRLKTANQVLQNGSRIVGDAMIDKLFAPTAPQELKKRWHEIMCGAPPMAVASALWAMADRPDSNPTLTTIAVPTLVVVGENDAITPISDARRMHQGIDDSQLEIIPDVGHMTPVEAPRRFAEVLETFLKSLGE